MKLAERAATTMSQQQREVRAGAGGDAVDRGDDRHRHRADAQRERLVVALDRRADVGGAARRLAVRRDRRIGEILAGAEAAAGAGDDDAAHAAVGGRGVERGAQLAVHRAGEAVERLRAVQRERADRCRNALTRTSGSSKGVSSPGLGDETSSTDR